VLIVINVILLIRSAGVKNKTTFTQQQILAVLLKQAKGLLKRILIEPRKHQAVIKV